MRPSLKQALLPSFSTKEEDDLYHEFEMKNLNLPKQKNFCLRCMSTFNISIFLATIIILVIGASVGVGIFLEQKQNDDKNSQKALEEVANSQTVRLNTIMGDTIRAVCGLSAVYSISNGSINFWDDFVPYINIGRALINGTAGLQFCPVVKHEDRATFTQEARQLGKVFDNFEIKDWGPNNTIYKSPNYTEYYPIFHSAPLATFKDIIGMNLLSSEWEIGPIYKARDTRSETATQTFDLIEGWRGLILFSPVFGPQNNHIGVAVGVFYIKELFALMKDPSSNMIVLDPLQPITDKYHVIWSSFGDKTYVQVQDIIKSFAYTSTRTITVADRKWTIIILPTSDFMKQVLGWQKWVALGGCILAAVFVSIVIATLIKRVEYNFVMNQLNKERLQLMHESQEKLSGYLEKIANQEQTLRSTIDAIPEWILVVDIYGKILSTNQSFDKKFGMSKKKLEEGVNVNDLFSKIEDGFYRHGEIDTMETQILDRYKSEVKVAVTTRPINNSYLLVIRNLTEQSTLLEQLKQQNEKMKQMDSMFELDQNLEDEKYKARLYQFCQMEKNSENLEFLDAVKNYKRMNVKDRIEKQQVIFDTFIKLGSEKQLNISRELSEEMRHNLEGSIGASTIFDGIVRHVKTILVLDVLPRFKETRTRD